MARITVEDCLKREDNRFALVLLAAKRTKQLLHGSDPLIEDPRDNKAVVTSLREIAEGLVRFKTEEDLAREREIARKARERELAESGADSIFKDSPSSASSGDSGDSEDSGAESNSGGSENGNLGTIEL